MKKIFRVIFKNVAKKFVGTGISKNKVVFAIVEKAKEVLKEDYIMIEGCKLLLDKTDRHGFTIYGEEDPEERELIKKVVKKDDNVVDIGANIGIHTITLAKCVGEKGHVFAFEPSPYNVKLIGDSVKLNNFQNVTVVSKAISDKPGKSKLFLSNGISAHSLSDFNYEKGSIDIEIESLDNYFNDYEGKINFLKIDAEGYDFKALKGAEKILKNKEVKILIEFFPDRLKKAGDSPVKFLEYLIESGFTVTDLRKKKILQLDSIMETSEFYDSPPPNHFTNLFCERKDK